MKAARFQNLRHIILNASAAHLDEDPFSGTEREDKLQRKLNIDTVLVVSESFCITVAAAACVASITMHGSQDSRFVVSSALEPFVPQKANLPIWQSFFLIAALIINAILRARQWQGRGYSRNSTSKLVIANSNVEERVQKLEEDTASVVTIIRVLSKQLEKLAVRFRVTRQTLRDPIQETALLAQRTSESVNVLAARENDLEKSLEEIHHVLLGMQENQTKQLALISTLGKLVKDSSRDKLEKHIKSGRNDQAGTQQGGRARMDNSDGASPKKFTEKLGSLIGNKTASAQLNNQKMLDLDGPLAQGRTQSKEPSKSNTVVQNTRRVDFWLNTPAAMSMEEAVPVARSRDHLSNDGRTFLDSTTESSFRHSDVKE